MSRVNSESLYNENLIEKVGSYIQEKMNTFSNKKQELKIILKEKRDAFIHKMASNPNSI